MKGRSCGEEPEFEGTGEASGETFSPVHTFSRHSAMVCDPRDRCEALLIGDRPLWAANGLCSWALRKAPRL